MADVFKLPGSSYEEFTKIILAYSSGKPGQSMSLDVVGQYASMDKTIVSRNNGFLVQCGLVSDGNQKAATELGQKLGRAYQLNMESEIMRMWREIIDNDEFLTRMLSAIRIRKTMEKAAFVNHVVYSSGASASKNAKTGAVTLVELYKVAGYISEQDGQIIAVDQSDILDNKLPVDENTPTSFVQPITLTEVPSANSRSAITINININVDVSELDELAIKLKKLLDEVKG